MKKKFKYIAENYIVEKDSIAPKDGWKKMTDLEYKIHKAKIKLGYYKFNDPKGIALDRMKEFAPKILSMIVEDDSKLS